MQAVLEFIRITSPKPLERKPTKDYVRNYMQIMQNKPNFPHFSPKNACFTKNKANSNPISYDINGLDNNLPNCYISSLSFDIEKC
jgi:hypothetical protein